MNEHTEIITMRGNPLTLLGDMPDVGGKAPEFSVINNDLGLVNLGTYKGKTLVIASVPSVDTPVCAIETMKFNREVGDSGGDIMVLTISMDLPFALKRFCAAEGIENVVTLSDHRDASFGLNYGVLIKELRLLARVIFIVDKGRVIRYRQIVHETTKEPDYEDVLNALQKIS
ncbi:MAG: thiol peroxidase [bacterium]|nr:thiol peroxidase [bacterium]